jgi:hypothetical protein
MFRLGTSLPPKLLNAPKPRELSDSWGIGAFDLALETGVTGDGFAASINPLVVGFSALCKARSNSSSGMSASACQFDDWSRVTPMLSSVGAKSVVACDGFFVGLPAFAFSLCR